MAESSRTPLRRDSQRIMKPDKRAKTAAPATGENPNQAPTPTPPRDEWAIPPLTKDILRVTTYVPTQAQSTPANKAATSAYLKKV